VANLDQRLLKISIEINGVLNVYENLAITAKGTKTGSYLQNEATVTIANLDKSTRDFLLTEGSPFSRLKTRKRSRVIIEAGRESYGTFILYEGDISTVQVTQPPDITVVIKCLTANFHKGNVIATSQPPITNMSKIAAGIAKDLGVVLDFQAIDKQISNYSFTGAAEKQVEKLYRYGDIDAYVDDGVLVVKQRDKALNNTLRLLSPSTGLVGIPEFIDYGIRTTSFVDNVTKVGSQLRLKSDVYPASSGDYIIYKLLFDVANRETPFYYISESRRLDI